jgi:hypothetical protein
MTVTAPMADVTMSAPWSQSGALDPLARNCWYVVAARDELAQVFGQMS